MREDIIWNFGARISLDTGIFGKKGGVMAGSISISRTEISRYPVIEDLGRQLEKNGFQKPFDEGVVMDQWVEGDGVILVSFGPGEGTMHGRKYTLFLDSSTGSARFLNINEAATYPAEKTPKINLSPDSVKKMFAGLFGNFAVNRTWARFSDSAKDFWQKNLARYDRLNIDGSYESDGKIDNVDIYGISRATKETPEQVYERIRPLIEEYNRLLGATGKPKGS